MAKPQAQRRLVNLLQQPGVQLRIGFINVALSFIFVAGLSGYTYLRLRQFAELVTTLTQAESEVSVLLSTYLGSIGITALVAGVLFLLVNLVASVYMTHRLVGPTVAFRRHIKRLIAGDFAVKTRLRRGDAFTEVAADLNLLSESLRATLSAEKDRKS